VAARAVAILDETPGLHSFLAVTGGEPLMQPEFLAALLPRIRRTGLNVLLETNGTRYRELDALRDLVDVVSMDFKLCSATGRPMPAAAHERFLATAVRRRRSVVYVKAVVSSVTTAAEIRQCAATIARVQESVPLILQPVTPQRPDRAQPPTPDALLTLQAVALELLPDVRVIPQTHKTIGQR
jgi:organic radical activating enzyme